MTACIEEAPKKGGCETQDGVVMKSAAQHKDTRKRMQDTQRLTSDARTHQLFLAIDSRSHPMKHAILSSFSLFLHAVILSAISFKSNQKKYHPPLYRNVMHGTGWKIGYILCHVLYRGTRCRLRASDPPFRLLLCRFMLCLSPDCDFCPSLSL